MFGLFKKKTSDNIQEIEEVIISDEILIEYEVIPYVKEDMVTFFDGFVGLELHISKNSEEYISQRLFSYRVFDGVVRHSDAFNRDYKKYSSMTRHEWDELVRSEVMDKLQKDNEIKTSKKNIQEMMDKLKIKGKIIIK